MILNAYTLHDLKARNFSPPFFAANHAVATRMLTDLVNDMNTTVGRHPADYRLFCVGSFDDQMGEIKYVPVHEHITDAVNCVAASPPDLFNSMRKE